MNFPFGRVVTRIRDGGVDEYGDPLPGSARLDIAGCAVFPRTSADVSSTPARSGVIVGIGVYFPPGSDVQDQDRFEIDGTLFQIEGEPGDWHSPLSGWEPGIEVALSRAAG